MQGQGHLAKIDCDICPAGDTCGGGEERNCQVASVTQVKFSEEHSDLRARLARTDSGAEKLYH
jgi:hypothetical protein